MLRTKLTSERLCTGLGLALAAAWLLGAGVAWPAEAGSPLPTDAAASTRSEQRAGIEQVLHDYIGLYAAETLDRWRELFHPGLVVAFPDDDGNIRVLGLEEFVERQSAYFATGRRISERLENVRIDVGRRIARVSADFVFMDEDARRRGKLGLHVAKAQEAWRIVAILFSYDDPR